jgi:hypothetical protein
MSQQIQYSGHGAKTGGLQGHSIGSNYPFMIAGTGDGQWVVIDARTSNESRPVRTYNEAQQTITGLRLRNMMHS